MKIISKQSCQNNDSLEFCIRYYEQFCIEATYRNLEIIMAGKMSLEKLNSMFKFIISGKQFDRACEKVKIIAGGNGSLTATLKIEEEHCNKGGMLHGAMTALLVDDLSGLALMTYPKSSGPSTGVSLSMNIQYMASMPLGKEIVIKASSDKVGETIAFLDIKIYNKDTGKMAVRASHIKFLGAK